MTRYDRIADEVDAACASGALPCEPAWNSLIPSWRAAYLPLLVRRLATGLVDLGTLSGLDPDATRRGWKFGRNAESAQLFARLTGERVMGSGPPTSTARLRVLRLLTAAYRAVFPFLSVAALIGLAVAGARSVASRRVDPLPVIVAALLGGVLVRSVGLSYQSVAGAEVMSPLYMAPLYGLVLLAACIGIVAARSGCEGSVVSPPG
jgi:hypothetical protein